MSATQGLGSLVTGVQQAVRTLGEIAKILSGVTIGSGATYATVVGLPAVTAANQGLVAYVKNGRNPGEGAGTGTGCLISVNSAGVWAAVWSGVAVTA